MNEDEYDDEQFEEDEVTSPPGRLSSDALEPQQQSSVCSWKAIDLGEIELGEQLGGGSVGLVHRGTYHGEVVALKTLVSAARCLICIVYPHRKKKTLGPKTIFWIVPVTRSGFCCC